MPTVDELNEMGKKVADYFELEWGEILTMYSETVVQLYKYIESKEEETQ